MGNTNPDIQNAVELEWMEQFSAGDKSAFKKIFTSYYSRLLWFADRYVKSRDIADDIVKELFIELWQKRSHIKLKSSLKSYLYTATRNRALNFIRQSHSYRNHALLQSFEEEELYLVHTKIKNPSELAEHKELEEAVKEAVESLPERCRLVFTLHRNQGFTYSEVAELMEISVKTVENQMARAFRILRDQLSRFLTIILLSKII